MTHQTDFGRPSSSYLHHLDRVEITRSDDAIDVTVYWKGVDRANGGGWQLRKNHGALAERLKKAIEAGDLYEFRGVLVDVDGNTYVSAVPKALGRTMNADLLRLGH